MRDVTFIIPMRSPEMSKDWARASKLTNRTLASIRNQLNPNWQCVLSCNRAPDGMVRDKRITVLEHPHPIPKTQWEMMLDKGEKKRVALEWLKDRPSRYAMLVDADDLVRSDLAAFVTSNHDAEGWIIRNGYSWYENHWPFLVIEDHFDQKCGTCYVLRIDGRYKPEGDCSNHMLMSAHDKVGRLLDVPDMPFRPVIQCRGTGENTIMRDGPFRSARATAKLALRSRPMNRTLRAQFAIPG